MLETGIQAALQASKVVEGYFGHLPTVGYKDPLHRDLVTMADKKSEEVIKEIILSHYPHHGFWGEESGQHGLSNEYVWIVDPLDGTTNFTLDLPLYSVSLALMHKNEIVLGIVYIPKTEELFYAERGRGAFGNDKKLAVSNTGSLAQAACSVEYWSKDYEHIEQGLADFTFFARRTKKIRSLSSSILELCFVAKGSLDFCVLDTYFLDLAAAKLIVEEAGGRCTLSDGQPVKPGFDRRLMRIIASNAALHPQIVTR
ncbi:MAG: Inositol monophosphatase family protein [Candidatus Magasanikbacteria bacterium GW2011_GWA2_56_11]|uniref:Inositol-1-monophosphatase n=1 Tax=Candidatus Magasanikbacteria bacterium GW2011_GWA2_56_11 TaxID=1619044 RepID=A0A0G2AMU7_9BACT|nr:MAG: Inositol monophosphatase family protein [Candidatus Magasanikbacteria bacterium GW2011_GWA2_56_11]